MNKDEKCVRCHCIKRKCLCRKERNVGVVEMRSRVAAGQMGDKRKEASRNACRGNHKET